nr:DUF6214 family protein [Streptomyces sp. LBUM 1487]
MLEASFLNLSDRHWRDGVVNVRPAWEVQEHDGATAWFTARLAFPDGAAVEVLAVVCEGRLSLEDVRAQPPLSLEDLTELADWIEGPLFEVCGTPPAYLDEERPGSRTDRGAGPGPHGPAGWRGGAWWPRSTSRRSGPATTRSSP